MYRCPSNSGIQWFQVQKDYLMRRYVFGSDWLNHKSIRNKEEFSKETKLREILRMVCEYSFKKEDLINSIKCSKSQV